MESVDLCENAFSNVKFSFYPKNVFLEFSNLFSKQCLLVSKSLFLYLPLTRSFRSLRIWVCIWISDPKWILDELMVCARALCLSAIWFILIKFSIKLDMFQFQFVPCHAMPCGAAVLLQLSNWILWILRSRRHLVIRDWIRTGHFNNSLRITLILISSLVCMSACLRVCTSTGQWNKKREHFLAFIANYFRNRIQTPILYGLSENPFNNNAAAITACDVKFAPTKWKICGEKESVERFKLFLI